MQTVSVTYKVDITNYLAGGATLGANGMRIGGNFTTRGASLPNWTPSAAACAMTNEGNNIWSITVVYPDSAIGKVQRYKFVNNDWGTNEGSDSLVAGGCGVQDGGDVNRVLTIPATNTTYSYCWDRCRACLIPAGLPSVSTASVSAITQTTASSGGNVTSGGTSPLTARGVCWSTSPNPTVALPTKTVDGTATGAFTSAITGLSPGTLYYVRAYATNASGTAYGADSTFSTQQVVSQDSSVVTFRVDITDFLAGGGTINNIVSIAGSFTDRGGNIPNWTPPAGAMTSTSNNIWERTIVFKGPAVGTDSLLWKYVQGSAWNDGDEGNDWGPSGGPRSCVRGAFNDRKILLPTTGNWIISSKWGQCAEIVNSANTLISKGSVSAFPNPSRGRLNLKFAQAGDIYSVVLVSSEGKTTEILRNPSADQSLDISSFSPGIYQLLVKSSTGTFGTRVSLMP